MMAKPVEIHAGEWHGKPCGAESHIMRNHWILVSCMVLLGTSTSQAAENGASQIKQLPAVSASLAPSPVPTATGNNGVTTSTVVGGQTPYGNSCPQRTSCKAGECGERPGCLHRIAKWFCYKPKTTAICELCQPFSRQPPLYLYFYKPLIEGPGHPYSPSPCNCWSGSCSSGVRMFASPTSQNAGFVP